MTQTAAPQIPDLMPANTLPGCPEGQDARVLAGLARDLAREDRVLLHIALDDARAATLKDLLAFFAPDAEVLEFPAWDCLPYDRVSPHADICARRMFALAGLLAWEKETKRVPRILLTTVNAALQRVTPRAFVEEASFILSSGGMLNAGTFTDWLVRNGYVRSETVREAGEFAQRGGIIDFFPAGADNPVRADLFGDTVESLRRFDPVTQRSEEKLESLSLHPASEFFLDENSVRAFRTAYRETFGVPKAGDPVYEAISESRRYNGAEHWLPLFFGGRMDTLFAYAPGAKVTQDHHAPQARAERLSQIRDFYQARKTLEASQTQKKSKDVSLTGAVYHPLPVEQLYIEEVADDYTTLLPFAPALEDESSYARKGRDFADIRALPEGNVFAALKDYMAALPKPLVAGYSAGSLERLKGMLEHAGIGRLKDCKGAADVKALKPGDVGLCVLPLENGFVAPDLAVITEQDILGDRMARRAVKRKRADDFLKEVSALAEGDLVVHIDHGVGRFDGLATLEAAGKLHDCLRLVYDGGDRLFVPVENIDVLSRFGSADGVVALDKLGGAAWQARKSRIKKDLMRMAEGLLKIAAARELARTDPLRVTGEGYERFSSGFPYQETEDQQRAIAAVLGDMATDKPMDRLVCGDVGFGKTEVALRAACAAAMAGTQVALVAPTTLLARQHYATFTERFKGTGVRVAQLSRLVSAKDAKAVKDGLCDGSVHVVIGTHALFAKDLKFAHLGLLIVDEEQRFGVKQKERLKELKDGVHVLTLTATPIPRTLQMSLAGVKEMSLIATPPVDRLAVRTFVLPFDPLVVREALLREHYRGGQSFYVCPRIKDLEEVEEQLKELVPEVKLIAAHGQMSPSELEDRMSAFYEGAYDVLLATNIIESGLDIPRANTMIVHRADMFGLAQLYQIRGRIGRSRVRAYAYLTYSPDKALTPQGMKRLEIMETLDTLGAGFQLASHDMDIRGAGNLLGEEQSGHIKEVGVELYQQMLEEAVSAARAGVDLSGLDDLPDTRWSPQINMGTSVLIPESYVTDLGVRMTLYRRLADLQEQEDIESFAAEMIDRFGPLPEEVENLLDIVRIKQLSLRAGVDRVDAGPKGAVIGFYKDSPPNVEGLLQWISGYKGAFKLRPDQKISAARQWENPTDRVRGIQSIMKDLAGLSC